MVLRLKAWESRSPPNLVRNQTYLSTMLETKSAALRGGFFVLGKQNVTGVEICTLGERPVVYHIGDGRSIHDE